MSDLPQMALVQQSKAKPKTGEELEVLGKQAAAKYCHGAVSTLSEAVIETVKSAGLSPEQLRRVVEFTNIAAFHHEFKKEGAHKVVEFSGGPASFADILQDMNSGAKEQVISKHAHDYDAPPPETEKLASANETRVGIGYGELEAAFGVREHPLPYANPLGEALDFRDKLAGAYDRLAHDRSVLETRFMDLSDRLFHEVKQASLSGTSLGQVVGAWHTVTDEPEYVKAAFMQLTPRLLSNGVFLSKEQVGESLTKTAGIGMVNPEHPLVAYFGAFCDTLEKLARVEYSQGEVGRALSHVGVFLKQASVAGEAAEAAGKSVAQSAGEFVRKGITEHIPKAWAASKRVSEGVSKPVQEFAEAATGSPRAGQIAALPVKYAPHLAALAAGEEAYQQTRYTPAVQTGVNFLLSRIPYTQPWIVRQHELMRNMY